MDAFSPTCELYCHWSTVLNTPAPTCLLRSLHSPLLSLTLQHRRTAPQISAHISAPMGKTTALKRDVFFRRTKEEGELLASGPTLALTLFRQATELDQPTRYVHTSAQVTRGD